MRVYDLLTLFFWPVDYPYHPVTLCFACAFLSGTKTLNMKSLVSTYPVDSPFPSNRFFSFLTFLFFLVGPPDHYTFGPTVAGFFVLSAELGLIPFQ